MKSKHFSLNLHDALKIIPALLSSFISFYLGNTEAVNNALVALWVDSKLLVAIFPAITYAGVLFVKWKKDGNS